MVAERKTPAEVEAHYLPRIAAARAAEDARRDEAWLGLALPLCGVPARPMSLADFLALRLAGNAHVCANIEPAEGENMEAFWARHDGVFLWRISPDYRPSASALAAFIERHQIYRLDLGRLHHEIDDYLRVTFADRIKPVRVEGQAHAPLSVAASFAACWIHDFSSAYGWTAPEVLDLPLAQIFQLRHLMLLEATIKAGKRPFPAGDESDQLAAQCFAEIAALS